MRMSKNTIYIIVIVICFLATGLLAYKFIFSSGGSQIPAGEMTWVKCNNPACNAEYEMSLKKYVDETQEIAKANPMLMTNPALTCEKCGKSSVYRAEKCQNPTCGEVFIRGIVPNALEDTCPKCGQSAIEESRKARLAERGE
jgi:predicted RNA-binding Zn-ribbon protein involved in translation (DUF1610 family)